MKFPAFKRFEELDAPADGWPPISEYGVRRIRVLMCAIALLSALVSFILPVIGAAGFFRQFSVPYSWTEHVEMVGKQASAPALLLLLNGFFIYCVLSVKRIPLWTTAFGFIVCGAMARNAGQVSHDFSHVVFAECSGIYGNVILLISVFIAFLIAANWSIEFRIVGCSGVTRNQKRILGLLGIAVGWLGALWFYEVI
ncbi:MAG: hypothetical protein EOP84_28525 [Verrucomicrobiaceae bacterium]|nr:MAG: hypothetical protein EOP84_28525 [Verrucomicrobiaceae bacterium]